MKRANSKAIFFLCVLILVNRSELPPVWMWQRGEKKRCKTCNLKHCNGIHPRRRHRRRSVDLPSMSRDSPMTGHSKNPWVCRVDALSKAKAIFLPSFKQLLFFQLLIIGISWADDDGGWVMLGAIIIIYQILILCIKIIPKNRNNKYKIWRQRKGSNPFGYCEFSKI